MTHSLRLPQYERDLSGFVGDLRSVVFPTQEKAAQYFHVSRSTITRYESGKHRPPVEYLACLARLRLEALAEELAEEDDEATLAAARTTLLREVNQAVRDCHDLPFPDWVELSRIADDYLTERRNGYAPAADSPPAMPAPESPPPPPFYIERPALQQSLRQRLQTERPCALAVWGPGGVGKTTLTAWLARDLSDAFPGGRLWIAWPQTEPDEAAVAEAQGHIARRLGLLLDSADLAERAARLRRHLAAKRCLLILDDVWSTAGLSHIRVVDESGCLLVTTRYRKVADVLEMALLPVSGMATEEGLALLSRWATYPVTARPLVERVGGLPLALKLCGAQLREGDQPEAWLAAVAPERLDLARFELDDPQTAHEGLQACFDRSLNRLSPPEQDEAARLGVFAESLTVAAAAAVWGVDSGPARRALRRLHNLALLERAGETYRFHPLLRAYARQRLRGTPVSERLAHQRHAAYFIRHALYHPQIVVGVDSAAPAVAQTWPEIVAGVAWAARQQPALAAAAALLAHTERPALVEAVGAPLLAAVATYRHTTTDAFERAMLTEVLGDLHLLHGELAAGLSEFEQANRLWQAVDQPLAGCRVILRQAGVHLLRQHWAAAAETARQAQAVLRETLPIDSARMPQADRLFYWFNMIYQSLIRWPDLPEADVAMVADLAKQTGQPLLEARGLYIHRLWCLTPDVERAEAARQRGRDLALAAGRLWRANGRRDRADDVISFTLYRLKNRYSRRTAQRFARRRSRTTPTVSPAHAQANPSEGERWWLSASAAQRCAWLSWMLPRYMAVDNRPHHPATGHRLSALSPDSRAHRWVVDILNVGALGSEGRRLMLRRQPPADHALDEAAWLLLSGQRSFPLVEPEATQVVGDTLRRLEADIA